MFIAYVAIVFLMEISFYWTHLLQHGPAWYYKLVHKVHACLSYSDSTRLTRACACDCLRVRTRCLRAYAFAFMCL